MDLLTSVVWVYLLPRYACWVVERKCFLSTHYPSILHGELVGVASLGPHEKQQCKLETSTWGLF